MLTHHGSAIRMFVIFYTKDLAKIWATVYNPLKCLSYPQQTLWYFYFSEMIRLDISCVIWLADSAHEMQSLILLWKITTTKKKKKKKKKKRGKKKKKKIKNAICYYLSYLRIIPSPFYLLMMFLAFWGVCSEPILFAQACLSAYFELIR